jgi:hypothetical protein
MLGFYRYYLVLAPPVRVFSANCYVHALLPLRVEKARTHRFQSSNIVDGPHKVVHQSNEFPEPLSYVSHFANPHSGSERD